MELLRSQVGEGSYIDRKDKTHKVIHSVIFTDEEKRELEDKIVEDLYRIFTTKAVLADRA